ncbi:hypothetical protein EK21DRAFT_118658 [Setomelanomma holmii]|uniref:Uncharacterized protein n=1 Tax=Setomelanomma holmii TaxID=210430 RepID=A0A9P4LFT0_9PLEO|nr:hypothetical protein EK21DRAFT_118658 [Setomelanomma holmii]
MSAFAEVKDFLKEISSDNQFRAGAKQVKFLQNKSAAKIASPDTIVEPEFSLALLKLREFLPPRTYCDRLISIYCNHFERTMRVLHIPTFMRQYEQLWRDETSGSSDSAGILPQLTAAMSMAYHMDDARELGEEQPHRIYLKGARRPILCLYKPLLLGQELRANIDMCKKVERHCLDTSVVMLSYQDLYTISALQTITNSPMAHQNFFYRCCKMDILWAALSCCQAVQRTGVDASSNLVSTMEFTISCLIDRIGQKGSDLKDIVFLALALRSGQLPDSTPEKPHALQQVMKRTLAACRERLLRPNVADQQHPGTSLTQRRENQTAVTLPLSDPSLAPNPVMETAFADDFTQSAAQWFEDLPDLAAEYSIFEANLFNSDQAQHFGMVQD